MHKFRGLSPRYIYNQVFRWGAYREKDHQESGGGRRSLNSLLDLGFLWKKEISLETANSGEETEVPVASKILNYL